ncbi:MAG: hypothetical protein GTO22_13570 [Gemmatimonadales bacterium]|nr:hypothetical protein [Gemmatimonadales bacterium]
MHRSLFLAALVPLLLAGCEHATPTETGFGPLFNTAASSTTLPGKIVVNHDEWTLGNTGFPPNADGDAFALSLASWFTGGGTGNFLVYSNDQFFNPSGAGSAVSQTMTGAGHGWTVSTASQPDADTWLATYDGVFLAGPAVPDNQVLIDYVEGGGNVYVAGGTGDFGGAGNEAAAWNTFLNHFNLNYQGPFPTDPWGGDYNGIGCYALGVSEEHPIFAGVTSLYYCNGNSVSDLAPADPTTAVLEWYEHLGVNHGLIAVYDAVTPFTVQIDIKPGSDPNCFNNDGHGVIPVAILGGLDFDVSYIDAGTVQLAGMSVAAQGKSNKLLAHLEDVNGDGYDDLVVQIEDQDGVFTSGTTTGIVTGNLYSGKPFEGSDELCIVP